MQGYNSSMKKVLKCPESEGQQRSLIKGTDFPSENKEMSRKLTNDCTERTHWP